MGWGKCQEEDQDEDTEDDDDDNDNANEINYDKIIDKKDDAAAADNNYNVLNRPGVAGAVLQSASFLID